MRSYLFIIVILFINCQRKPEIKSAFAFYGNNKIKSILSFNTNTKTSTRFEFYKNGKIKSIVFKKNKSMHGPFIKFDSVGHIQFVNTYNDGKLDGLCLQFYKSNKLKESSRYRNGNIIEEMVFDSLTGKCKEYYLYHNERIIEILNFNKTGLTLKRIRCWDSINYYGEDYVFFNNNKLKSFSKYMSKDYNYGDDYYKNSYDSVSGKIIKTYRVIDYTVSVSKDSITIEPYFTSKFDKLSNYNLKITNTTDKNKPYLVIPHNNIFKIKTQRNLRWLFEVCDSHGCYSLPITFSDAYIAYKTLN